LSRLTVRISGGGRLIRTGRSRGDARSHVARGDQQDLVIRLDQAEQSVGALLQVDHPLHVVRDALEPREIAHRDQHDRGVRHPLVR
jgi:hypothetical protein